MPAEDVARHPYALSLPLEQFEAQLAELTAAIARGHRRAPVSYQVRAASGFRRAHVAALERRGYLVESSVAPLFNESRKGGPDFVTRRCRPTFSRTITVRPGTSHSSRLPYSAALNRRVPLALAHAYGRVPWQYTTRRVLRKLGVARMDFLRPSYSSLDAMCALARRITEDGVPVLNLLFHSSEGIVGGSPYNRTRDELDRFLERLDRFLHMAVTELQAIPATFKEFHAQFVAPPVKPVDAVKV